jgi:hypothetical protein
MIELTMKIDDGPAEREMTRSCFTSLALTMFAIGTQHRTRRVLTRSQTLDASRAEPTEGQVLSGAQLLKQLKRAKRICIRGLFRCFARQRFSPAPQSSPRLVSFVALDKKKKNCRAFIWLHVVIQRWPNLTNDIREFALHSLVAARCQMLTERKRHQFQS